jgi:hypothetical protein
MSKTRSLFGFSADLVPFIGKSPAEQVATLRELGNTAIFGGYGSRAFVEAAHLAGMPVYAEYGCFAGQHWWERVPESRPITNQGALLDPDGWYCGVNPADPQVRQGLLAELEVLLREHEVDGVWLDFIRWPCHWEVPAPYLPDTSYDAPTLAAFCWDMNVDIPTADPHAAARAIWGAHRAAWTAWRCAQVTTWVAEARAVLRRVRPQAILGLFGVPWRLADREGAILRIVGQDYRALGQYIDVFSPMVYHRMCGQPPEWIGDVVREIRELGGKPVWPIIQSIDEPSPLPAEEYGRALDIALSSLSAEGVLVYTLKGALEGDRLAVTEARLKSS